LIPKEKKKEKSKMNSSIAVNPGHLTSSVLDIPLERIRESKTNPRRTFDETKLAELADSVAGNKIRIMWPSPFCGIRTR
jgi:hypothetical protein